MGTVKKSLSLIIALATLVCFSASSLQAYWVNENMAADDLSVITTEKCKEKQDR